jgi:hypothetical protein
MIYMVRKENLCIMIRIWTWAHASNPLACSRRTFFFLEKINKKNSYIFTRRIRYAVCTRAALYYFLHLAGKKTPEIIRAHWASAAHGVKRATRQHDFS